MAKNESYVIPDGPHKGETWWNGCLSGCSGITLGYFHQDFYILGNERGRGCSEESGKWNLPCGFIEPDENGQECISREIREECGIFIPPKEFRQLETETEPSRRHKGHITVRYIALIDENTEGIDCSEFGNIGSTGGEKDEVSQRKWIKLGEYQNYRWAFVHAEVIKEIKGIIEDLMKKDTGVTLKSIVEIYRSRRDNF